MIKLIDLTKKYRKLVAVDRINLEVKKGVVFGFLGPNGAGKTTTLRMMAGVLRPTSGKVLLNGIDIIRSPAEAKRIVGYIPDSPFLYEKLTAREFLNFISGLYSLDSSDGIDKKIQELLEKFGLTHWSDELIESFSHGMKQRLVMCSALLHDPDILIVDEPMVGLDPRASRMVKELFTSLAEKGKTLFISTHSLEVAQAVCHQVAIIQAGRIIAQGTPDELKSQAGVDGDLEEIFLTLTQEGPLAHEKPLSSH
jgi:ABC-2 type transport system ATP-binding protein